jgi:uroporphyrinogen decarboxylase
MTGKEILLKTLKSEPAERIPWVPFVGVHGGQFVGADATAYLQSADTMAAGLEAAAKRYQPDGLPVSFDLQLEAEVLGCELAWAKETPPSVAGHPLDDDYNLNGLPEFDLEKGRFPQTLEVLRRLSASIGDSVALYGLLTGPLTLAMHLRGEDFLLDMFDEEDEVETLLTYCTDIAITVVNGYLENGADVIAVVDPMISQIGPAHFSEVIAPHLNRIFDAVREAGGLSSLFVCGNATRNLEAMAETTCDNMCVDENVDLVKLGEVSRASGKSFGGNLKLTTVLLLGDADDTRRDVARCLREAGEGPGFVLAPGCDLPYAAKPENLEVVSGIVHDEYQLQIAISLPERVDDDPFDDITPPDYGSEPEVILDVVTLDSKGCAPCAYILKAAEEAAKHSGRPTSVREHKITGRDGLGYMKKLGVTAIPSICVDGKEAFASIIPDREELVRVIETAASTKST